MTISPPERGSDAKSQVEKVDNPATFELFGKPGHFDRALAKGPKTTSWVWNLHANAHDFDAHTSDLQEVSRRIFSAHFGHLAVIFIWLSGAFFHGARFSNYSGWLADPTHVKPSAQVVWPIFGQEILNGDMGAGFQGIQITSGLFHVWRGWGITSETQLMALAIGALVMAGLMLNAGVFHYHKAAPKLEWFQNVESMLNHHLAGLLGLGSLSWAGHLIHVSAPVSKLMDAIDAGQPLVLDGKTIATVADIPLPHEFFNQDLLAQLYPGIGAGIGAFFSGNWAAYSDFLTFKGGLNPVTGSLWMTDIAHHHVAIAVLFIVAGHMYRTNWGIGHSIKEIHEGQKGDPLLFPAPNGHDGLYEFLTTSWHAQLGLNLAMLGSLSIIVAQHMYAMPPYAYMAVDYPTQIGLFTHHMWIGGFLIVGGAAHAAIAMVRDYDPAKHIDNVLDRVLKARDAIISHLNWVCIWLGAHSFGLYIHNDTMRALGRPQDMFSDSAISIQPIFAQWIQNAHAAAAGSTAPNALAGVSEVFNGSVVAVGGKVAAAPMPLGTADFMVHHIHAFTIHVTVLILLKGVLYARSSRLIPDKANLGFRFSCDGPGRGGTCQVSAWDHVFLGLFWMYNSLSIVIFHFSWKMQSDIWGTVNADGSVAHITNGNFAQSAITINGWLRDYLWAQAVQVINSYGSNTSAYGIMFLGAHFIWAFSLMFLFSGRGYWQELIESIVWAHNKLKVAPAIQPRALSIIQGRAVGVAHYLLGGIATTWAFFHAHILVVG
ncbi:MULTISPECIES: photosystem I core protein PsaA [Synechococcales]|jgi:photosystem I P700 chlorophyll a apoprotein A1|uniref:Photosystem I P700 chlorophyll a apoprotein A1 n=1 Tax=Parasynechococcus marenigrum (strain WH8102) TaxID=84588 RepID=PSAA_PARMW|nr:MULTISPECIES: photosystem I core protein PsaA [Synechococcales]Q7U4E4.1 RecName: Full=Photosystem I P700 chlorophyll a apoprotein A1; AltName: Full=PsaA [Parasynechococcus marenigrum WH 8102]MBA4733373.1 photosystem I core protein PsaA [Synechococcus sp.]QNI52129.1 photosystem I core protein PsaA [Synechococcus sp. RS9915]QNI92685.1 photosystem I core protein PsaA [Synechococcus sp. BOUM118]QNJ15089.1 photosystem I core protein PsaA [Synechococcus sp. A18-46.1]QNJ17896.1 photosystem I core